MQLHKRQDIAQVRLILGWYDQHLMSRDEALKKLGVKRRRFYELLKQYRSGSLTTLAAPRTNAHRKLSSAMDAAIRAELAREHGLIADKDIPITTYNYAAIRDRAVEVTGTTVSAQTVRNRARAWGYYLPKKAAKTKHDRVVLTTATGLLLQHDASHHKWSPFAIDKWCLITTIDDYSRLLVYAELWEAETTWAHIQALKAVVTTYGAGGSYYTDNHSIFRYVERQESYWHTQKRDKQTVQTQWERAVRECGMDIVYAMSPEAKGKIERPYRWLQDRIVRSCAKAGVTDIQGARDILRAEVNRYNNRQVHSTTGEIPAIRFARAREEGNTVFRPFVLPSSYHSLKDVICLKEDRVVNGYNQIRWRGGYLKIPRHIPEGATVHIHILPDSSHPELRVWYKDELVQSVSLAPTQRSIPKQ